MWNAYKSAAEQLYVRAAFSLGQARAIQAFSASVICEYFTLN